MTRVVKCALLQVGSDVPMTEPVEVIRAAMNQKCAGLIANAARQGTQILVLPELFTMPYFARFTDSRWYAAAEPIPNGPTISLMRDLARQYAMVIVAPIYELDGQARYNSAAVIDADGKYLGVYRKHHVPTCHTGNYEPFYFHQPDLGFPVFDTVYARIGIYICYDRHFPEVARIYGVKGAEIVFNPSATGGKNSERVWELEQQAYALNNGYFLAALNRIGRGEPFDVGKFFGKSYFCNPFGEIIAQGGKGTEEIVSADLDLDEIASTRNIWHTNRLYLDRRPTTYLELFESVNQTDTKTPKEANVTLEKRKEVRYKPIITQEMKDAAIRALDDGRMIRSNLEKDSEGGRFEDEFCRYIGAKHGIAVSSGFAALHVALMAAGIGPGDEVITESRSFISVGDVVVLAGATPVFVDIDPLVLNIDPALIEAAITPRTKAIMPIHNNGLTCDMDPIREIARRHGLKLIVDSCQAIGTSYKGSRPGTLGDISAFSFVRNKSMTCGGEGGMVITDDDELAYRSMLLSNHGRGSDYRESHNSELIGFNYRLSEILAAIGRVQLRHVDDWNNQRRTNTAIYQELFARRELPITYTIEPTWGYHTRMRSVLLVLERDALVEYLHEQGIQASSEYKVPIHLNRPYVAKFGFHKGQLPITERIANETIVLPGWPGITRGDLEYVVDAVERFYNK
jgi:N-carbamoylputrescine amidase